MARRVVICLLLLSLGVGACAGSAGAPGATDDAPAPPTEESVAPAESEAAVETPTPTPAPTVEVVRVFTLKRPSDDDARTGRVLVIAEVRNPGVSGLRFERGAWTAPSAGGVETKADLYGYPTFLAPGETGYLMGEAITDSAAPLDSIGEATVDYLEYSDQPGPNLALEVSKAKTEADWQGDLTVSCVVTNRGDRTTSALALGVILFDRATGEPVMGYSTGVAAYLEPGQSGTFPFFAYDDHAIQSQLKALDYEVRGFASETNG